MSPRFHAGSRHADHLPGIVVEDGIARPSRDLPERVDVLRRAAAGAGMVAAGPIPLPPGLMERVHAPDYLAFLRDAHVMRGDGDPGRGVVPGETGAAQVRAARYMTDALAPIREGTWDAVRESAALAAAAAADVRDGARLSYAICRPPGHHAGRAFGGGAAYVNNAALAATVLRERVDRVLIVDIDVHHGNGTQEIFAERGDVFTLSLHRDPRGYYPHASGFADERGTGPGRGACLNVPLPKGTGDAAYLAALVPALDRALAARPGALVVSLGFDAHLDDPARGMRLTDQGFAAIGRSLAAPGLPTVLVQEGGYALDRLGGTLDHFLTGFIHPALSVN